MRIPRVLLADDHALVLGAFEKLLSPECEIVGRVSDGLALVEAAKTLKPDAIVLDIEMPRLNGLDAARQIKALLPHVQLVFLTMHEESDLAAEAFRAGASAYVLKQSAPSELLTAIREVLQGRSVRHTARDKGSGWLVDAPRQPPTLQGAHRAAAGDPAIARRRSIDEGSRCGAEPFRADSRLPQVPESWINLRSALRRSSFNMPSSTT